MISLSDISRWSSEDTLERVLVTDYEGNADRLVADINKAVNHLLHADLDKAGIFIQKSQKCFKLLPHKYYSYYKAIQARYCHWQGQSKKALALYSNAINDMMKFRDFKAVARTRLGLMDVLMYLGRSGEAVKAGKKSLRYFRNSGNAMQTARIMTNIGNVYHRQDKNKTALQYYEKARVAFEDKGGFPLALVDFNRANIYTNYNEFDKARKLYQSASATYQDIGMSLGVSKANYSLAYLDFLEGKFSDALKHFDDVIECFDRLGDGKSVAIAELDIAELHVQLNQYSAALYFCERSLTLLEKYKLRYESAKAHFFIAEAFRKLDDFARAEESLGRANHLFRQDKNLLWQGMVQLSRGKILQSLGKYRQALKASEGASRLFSKSGDTRRKTDAEIVKIGIRFHLDASRACVLKAVSLLKKPLLGDQKFKLLNILGDFYLSRDNTKRALNYYRKSIDLIEKMLANLYPDEIRFFFAADKYPAYLGAVNCLLTLGQVEESFVTHSRALAMVNRQYISESAVSNEIPVKLLNRRSQLRASLKKYNKLSSTTRSQVVSHEKIKKTEQQLWHQDRIIRNRLSEQLPAFGKIKNSNYGKSLMKGETLLNFVQRGNEIGVFCVSKEKTTYIACPVQYDQLQGVLREMHFLMEKDVYSPAISSGNSGIETYLTKLSEYLIEPVLKQLSHKIILLVDGIFSQIPFGAFPLQNGMLFHEVFRYSIIVNPEDLGRKRGRKDRKISGRSAVFAPQSSGLPLIDMECRKIKQHCGNALIYNSGNASSRALKAELKRTGGFVHIASHASRSSENPLFSKILLDDGPFYPFDLFGEGISAELVSLSGCQTAAPGIYYGNSFSLAKAFYQAGARYVLATLWPVSDKVSMVFMSQFYSAVGEGKPVLDAFRMATEQTIEVNSNPAFWSSFVLLGL